MEIGMVRQSYKIILLIVIYQCCSPLQTATQKQKKIAHSVKKAIKRATTQSDFAKDLAQLLNMHASATDMTSRILSDGKKIASLTPSDMVAFFNFIAGTINHFPDVQSKVVSVQIQILAAIVRDSAALSIVGDETIAKTYATIAGNINSLQSSDKAALFMIFTTAPLNLKTLIGATGIWPDVFGAVLGFAGQGGDSAAQAIINSTQPTTTTTSVHANQVTKPHKKTSAHKKTIIKHHNIKTKKHPMPQCPKITTTKIKQTTK
jgi:hypothetical protein